LSTHEILAIIDELKALGTLAIAFDGGEPLLRDDIGEILSYCKSKRLFITINTNGSLVPKKIREIKKVDYLKISFDGPPEIHNYIRGDGTYSDAVKAIVAAKENYIEARLNTTLTKYNLRYIDFILNKAEEWNLKVKFQPVINSNTLYPRVDEYRQAIKKIILEKSKCSKYIINSLSSLNYIYTWPSGKPLKCYAGILFCRISPMGNVYPCNIMRDSKSSVGCKDYGFKEVFKNMPRDYSCTGCWCTTSLELNYFLSFKIDALSNVYKIMG